MLQNTGNSEYNSIPLPLLSCGGRGDLGDESYDGR